MLDLLGTFAGVAFLVGAIALAVRVDRREARFPSADGDLGERPGPGRVPGGPPRLRVVHDADR
jgi:hypothetical protein